MNVNARKTHCPRGHAFDETNIYHDPRGGRQCLTCRRLSQRAYHGRRPPRRLGRTPLTFQRRFQYKLWARGDCWEWRGKRDRDGYGIVAVGRADQQRAHRVSYELAKGSIPPGYVTDHLCNHPWCVRPSHLLLCRQAENITRAGSRSRAAQPPTRRAAGGRFGVGGQ